MNKTEIQKALNDNKPYGRNWEDFLLPDQMEFLYKAFEQFAAPPPASEGEMEIIAEAHASELYDKEGNNMIDVIEGILWQNRKSNFIEGFKAALDTLPTREPEEKEKFAVRFSEWLMIQCDYKNHCVWEYQGEEYTQQELIEIFKRMTPSLPTQSITN